MNQDDLVSEMQEILETVKSDPGNVPQGVRKRFWRIVGLIKRDPSPNSEIVAVASEIRDILYTQRLGSAKPLNVILLLYGLCGIVFIVSGVLARLPNQLIFATILQFVFVLILMFGYVWIADFGKKLSLIILLGLIGAHIVFYSILFLVSTDLLTFVVYFGMIAAIPSFYLHGRYVGGVISGIKFDGVTRDVYFLLTLKINYKTYLLAQPPARQWIFFCGGIGTVVTTGIVATIQFLWFGDLWLYLIMFALFFGEMFDLFLGTSIPGEMGHLRRERRIVRDWRKKLDESNQS